MNELSFSLREEKCMPNPVRRVEGMAMKILFYLPSLCSLPGRWMKEKGRKRESKEQASTGPGVWPGLTPCRVATG